MVGNDLGETMGNIIAKSCFSVIGAKRLHIPTLTFGFPLSRLGNAQASLAFRSLLHRFHMEADNRCKDECLPEKRCHRSRHKCQQAAIRAFRSPQQDSGRQAAHRLA